MLATIAIAIGVFASANAGFSPKSYSKSVAKCLTPNRQENATVSIDIGGHLAARGAAAKLDQAMSTSIPRLSMPWFLFTAGLVSGALGLTRYLPSKRSTIFSSPTCAVSEDQPTQAMFSRLARWAISLATLHVSLSMPLSPRPFVSGQWLNPDSVQPG